MRCSNSSREATNFSAPSRSSVGVETLVDVRCFPGSRRNPQFTKAALAGELGSVSIAYVHVPDLGDRRSGLPGEDRFECSLYLCCGTLLA
jgi:uncharacterized protein (DUF488 family)